MNGMDTNNVFANRNEMYKGPITFIEWYTYFK